MFKYLYLRQILSYPNKPYINRKRIYSAYLFSYMMYKYQFKKIDT